MVLYRKYRPQKIAELDIENVREKFVHILSSGRIPHAFLFSGPKGTGKTSAARIVAKVINCELRIKNQESSTKNIEPCNKCESCVSITEGRNLDVLEIDAASNRGIDEIRELKEKIKLSPVSARFKVYIIDEVHMLTTEAFNALLKTLEEPPAHAIFILATTEMEKLLPTIVSRCARVDFAKATNEEIAHSLERVIKGEKLKIADADKFVSLIAGSSEGSFRDATKLLEQAMLEDALSYEKLVGILGFVSGDDAKKLLVVLSRKDAKKALSMIEEMGQKGVNFKSLTANIVEVLHDLLLEKFEISKNKTEGLDKLGTKDIEILIRLFTRAYGESKYAVVASLPLEMVVVEWSEG